MTFQDPFHRTDLLERLMVPQEGSKTKIVLLGTPRPREQGRGAGESWFSLACRFCGSQSFQTDCSSSSSIVAHIHVLFGLYRVFPHHFISIRWNKLSTVRAHVPAGTPGWCGAAGPLDKTCAFSPTVSQLGTECALPLITKFTLLFLKSESYEESEIFWVPAFPTKVENKFIYITCRPLG